MAGASPALVSSLLIHGDQSVPFDVWLSVCPFHTLRAVVKSAFCCATQLPFQFRLVALCLRVHHQVNTWQLAIASTVLHSHANCDCSPLATCADLMAHVLSTGMLVGVSTAPAGNPQPLMAPHKAAVCTLFHAPMISGLFCPPWLVPASAIIEAGRTATPGLALSDVPPNRVPRFHRMGRNFNLPT